MKLTASKYLSIVLSVGTVLLPAAAHANVALVQAPIHALPPIAISPQGDGNLSTIGSNGVAYRYARPGISIDLDDRDGHWSHAEALAVRDGLDQLPDIYVVRALSTGIGTFFRDAAIPHAPWEFLHANVNSSACTVPPAPWHFIAFADGAFYDNEWTYQTVTHELGHAVNWTEDGWGILVGGSPFYGFSWCGVDNTGKKSWNGFVSDYATTDFLEDYAESCCYYWLDPDNLKAANPSKFAYVQNNVFKGLMSPASARRSQTQRAWQLPHVDSLSNGDASEHSEITVHGENFMGPLDGGFNVALFGGTSDFTHVPVSESTLWAWTPNISSGSQPCSVKTEDGTSNQVAFTIDSRPWWKFW